MLVCLKNVTIGPNMGEIKGRRQIQKIRFSSWWLLMANQTKSFKHF